MLTKDLKHGMVIPSMYNNLGLFINHYPNGVSFIYKLYISKSYFPEFCFLVRMFTEMIKMFVSVTPMLVL